MTDKTGAGVLGISRTQPSGSWRSGGPVGCHGLVRNKTNRYLIPDSTVSQPYLNRKLPSKIYSMCSIFTSKLLFKLLISDLFHCLFVSFVYLQFHRLQSSLCKCFANDEQTLCISGACPRRRDLSAV